MVNRQRLVTLMLLAMMLFITGLLGACSSNKAPTWSLTATEKPGLQAKQINTPLAGTNYILCEKCVHYDRLPANQNHKSRLTKKRSQH